jgi:hypothetical protein
MVKAHIARCYLAVLAVLVVLNGCVATQPFPNAARAGDTVTLAVGSADGMTADNTTVDFYPGPGPDLVTPIPVPVRSVVKIYPDKSSNAWLGADPRAIPRRSSHGGWLSVIAVDLPASLPDGDGVIRVTTNGEVVYPRFSATANGTDILMTILPGSGSSHTFTYSAIEGSTQPGDLTELEPKPQVIIKPPVPAEGAAELASYGAIEFDVTIPLQSLDGSPIVDEGFAVMLDDQPQNTSKQVNLLWKRNGNNFNIMLVSPVGMYSYQSRVSVVPLLVPAYLYVINGTPVINSATYYDLNGALTSGPMPDVTVVN